MTARLDWIKKCAAATTRCRAATVWNVIVHTFPWFVGPMASISFIQADGFFDAVDKIPSVVRFPLSGESNSSRPDGTAARLVIRLFPT